MAHSVTLSWYEQLMAGFCGMMRDTDSHRWGRHRELFSGFDSDTNDVYAAGAEMAVAKLTNRYWIAGIGDPKLPDVGRLVEVRWSEFNHCLKVRDKDPDDRPYVFVRGSSPSFEIVGWMLGREAKQQRWKANPGDKGEMYLVPSGALNDMEFLIRGNHENSTL